MNLSNEMTEEDFKNYLKHLENIGCIIDDWSYIPTDRSWKVNYRLKPTSTPEKIEIEESKENDDSTCGGMLSECEQCNEIAWDGRICHACGAKNI